jgi:hypothetical protein
MTKLIKCSDGMYAPTVVVCRHLFDGESNSWNPVSGEGEEVFDWLCPECLAKFPADVDVDDLKAVCMHCARQMREDATGRGDV